jgi:hypothetical protein
MNRVVTDHTAACERPVRDCSFLSRARKPSRDSSSRSMSSDAMSSSRQSDPVCASTNR